MKKQKFQLSVGISAYNEEKNIQHVITTIVQQRSKRYFLTEIIVVADGCTDKTVEIIKKIPDKRIKLIIKKTRKGQSVRQNELLGLYRGDAILILEADILLARDTTIDTLVHAFSANQEASLIYGRAEPVSGRNFYGEAIASIESVRQKYLMVLRNGNNIYTLQYFKLLSRAFTSHFRWPDDVHDDTYIYMYCIDHNHVTIFEKNAVIQYRAPGSLRDYINKSLKFSKAKNKLHSYFSEERNHAVFHIPRSTLYSMMIECLYIYPFYSLVYLFSFVISRSLQLLRLEYNPLWETAVTTKSVFINKTYEDV